MKHFKIQSLLATVTMLPLSLASAISPEITGDLYFDDGVYIEGVSLPEDQDALQGSSSVQLGGSGTLTVGSKTGGGFPRVTVLGGTTITSNRYWNENTSKPTWWDGQFSAPGKSRMPNKYDINYSSVNELEVLGAYTWGVAAAGEVFSFSTPARMVFPVKAIDGQKVLLAYNSGGQWSINSANYCIVKNELCYTEVSSMRSIALVREVYSTCPIESVEHGTVGTIPGCVVTCNRGFELGSDGVSCKSTGENFLDEGGQGDGGGHSAATDGSASEDQGGQYDEEVNYEETNEDPFAFPNGYFRYQGTRDQRFRKIDESGLEGDELKKVKQLNRGYYSRNARSIDDQLPKEEVAKEVNDGFLNYLLQMRNSFKQKELVAQNNELKEKITSGELVASDEDEGEDGKALAGTLHSGAPLLPSTGPEVFVTIAVIGFLMMLFGARRRN